jgi:hypothetical protein
LPFFQISPDAYLYPEKVKHAGARKQLEEPVRQWCGYELIRAYGVAVTDIEFERPVRMGSRSHWIDILISRGGKPAVVVECKKPSDRNLEKGMEQALSYADAAEIRAEFACNDIKAPTVVQQVSRGLREYVLSRNLQNPFCNQPR